MSSDFPATRIHLAGFSRHETPFHYVDQLKGLGSFLFRLQTEGEARALVDGQMVTVQPGDLLLYAPGDPYALHIDVHDESVQHGPRAPHALSGDYYVYCAGPWIESWWTTRQRRQMTHIPLDERITILWRQLAMEQYKNDAVSDVIADHLLQVLCLMLDRVVDEIGTQYTSAATFVPYRMRSFIDENALRSFTVKDVADHVGMSVSRAMYLFKESFGTSMKQYAMEVRLNMARTRIAFDDMPLEHVAEMSGFSHYSYFYRVFRAHFGKSPSEYRQENR